MTKSCALFVSLTLAVVVSLCSSHASCAAGVLDAISLEHADMRFVDRRANPDQASPLAVSAKAGVSYGSQWNALVREAATGNLRTALDAVQRRFNRFTYIADSQSGARKDFWIRPSEFVQRGGGDCEDFAITKYAALVQLGVDPEDMAVMVYLDMHRQVVHAVLLVKLGGVTYVLDSLRDDVRESSKTDFGRPLFALNGHTKRIFVGKRAI